MPPAPGNLGYTSAPAIRANTPERAIYTVDQLNREVAELLTRGLGRIWIAGELSNFSQPRSGHWYFTLKDSSAQVRCAMFKNANRLVRTPPREGDQILLRATVGLYTARGDYQLIAEHMEPAGEGALRLAFEQLKQTLKAEGLFDADRKQALPATIRTIGVVTSATGAAIRDIVSVLERRCPLCEVVVFPVPVQGDAAAPAIAAAIEQANQDARLDVLIVGRGGGSIEDLWAFNEERVARAIAASKLPIISAVGHEVDVSIADLVADVRAATPSAAAELVSVDLLALASTLQQMQQRLARTLLSQSRDTMSRVGRLAARLGRAHPGQQLQQKMQRVDELEQRLERRVTDQLFGASQALRHLSARIHVASPAAQLMHRRANVVSLQQRLARAARYAQNAAAQRLAEQARALNAVSPLAVLDRGYAVATGPRGEVVVDAGTLKQGASVALRFAKGSAQAEIISVDVPA